MGTRRPTGPPLSDVEQLLREVLSAPLVVAGNPYNLLSNPVDLTELGPGLLYWSDHGALSAVNPTAVFAGVANPTASVGLSAVNGIALTAMRSDGAPPLSQAIVPTWSGKHTFQVAPQIDIASAAAGYALTSTDADGNVVWSNLATLYQPLDPDLTAIATLVTDPFGRGLLQLANDAEVRSYIGAGTGVGSVTSVDVSGGATGLTTSGGPITGAGTITLAGTLAATNGGTGITALGSGIATFLGATKPTTIGGYGITDFVSLGDLEWSQLGHGHAAGEITGLGSFALISSLAHSALTGITANDHHAQAHVLATATALGADHSVSGLTAGQILRAASATTAAFTALVAGDIPDLSGTYSVVAHTHAFASLTSKPTTIGGYGITDFNSLGDARWSLLGHTHAYAPTVHTHDWADITGEPSTIGGYGITDFNSLGDARWSLLGHVHSAADITSGALAIARGGSNKALTLSAGGILWTDADSFEVLAAGSAGQFLLSGGVTTPTWLTPGTGVATWLAIPSSANLAAAVTGETGTGALVFGTTPTITTPDGGPLTIQNLSGSGVITMGFYTPSGAYSAFSMHGAILNDAGYNFASSPGDTNLYINRPTGKSFVFLENGGAQQVIINPNELNVQHGQKVKITQISNVNYTAALTDYLMGYSVLATSDKTVTLPLVVNAGSGKIYVVKDLSGNAAPGLKIIIQGTSSQTIEGSLTKEITTPYGSLTFFCPDGAGTNWLLY